MRSSTLLFLHWLHCFIDILYHVPVSSSCFICFNFNFAYTLLKQNIYLCVMPLSRGRFNKYFRSCQIGCPRLFKPWGDLISWRGHGTPLDTVSKTCNFLYSKEFPIYQNYFRWISMISLRTFIFAGQPRFKHHASGMPVQSFDIFWWKLHPSTESNWLRQSFYWVFKPCWKWQYLSTCDNCLLFPSVLRRIDLCKKSW